MKPDIVIVSCGFAKLDRPALAGEMYTGQYFRACYETAVALAAGRVFILSARYGLMRPWQKIEPYELRLGQEGSVTAAQLRIQAQRNGILSRRVIALCGQDYANLVCQVWTDVGRPLQGLGIGQQKHRLVHLRRGEWDCARCRRWKVA